MRILGAASGLLVALTLMAFGGWVNVAPAFADDMTRHCGDPAPERSIDSAEQRMLDRLNSHRAQLGLPEFELSSTLMRVARAKSVGISQGLVIHDDLDRSWEERFYDCGYPVEAAFGEILGCEASGPDDLFTSWQESPVHSGILANELFVAAGIARVSHPDGFQCWVVDLGSTLP